MQVWTKLWLGFTMTAVVIVGTYGAYQLQKEARDLRAGAERDVRRIAAAMQVAIENAFRDDQASDVREIVNAVQGRDPSVDVVVFDPAGVIAAASPGGAGADLVRSLADEGRTSGQPVVRFEGRLGLSMLLAAFPIRDDSGSTVGVLTMARSLGELRQDLSSEIRATVLSLLTLVLGLAGAGWGLSLLYVRRPLSALVQTMRAIRAGDLTAKASLQRHDEIGTAIAEFNALMDDLGKARRRLIAEAEAREAMEAGLQRADKLVTLGQLSAGLAHEIGSPLQILSGRARALAATAGVPAEVRRSAEIMAAQSDRITRIVDQLMTFSRYSAPCAADIALGAPVQEIVEFFEPEARRHDVLLEFEAGESLPTVAADVGQVQQVVMNLLSNAVRAAGPGGRVRVGLAASSFTAGGEWRPSVSLVVEDTGDGIPEEVLPHVFEPFFTTRGTGGTGLGLAVVKSIVDAHGGSIAVTTRVGEGTRVAVHLPPSASAAAGGAVA